MSPFDDELDLDWSDDSRIWVNGERLKTLRTALGYDTKPFAKAIGTSTTSVNNMERPGKQRTQSGSAICRLLGTHPEALTLPPPPEVARAPFFRTSASMKNWEKPKAQAQAVARLIADVADYFDQRVGIELPPLPNLASARRPFPQGDGKASRRAAAAAQELRATLKLPPGRIVNMIRVATQAGALVAHAPSLRASIHAYATVVGRWNLIVLSSSGDYYRERWGVAHELGHLLLHEGDLSADQDVEFEANQFAAELLLPAAEVRGVLPSGVGTHSLQELQQLKEIWGVSIATLVRRANEVGRMHDAAYAHAKEILAAKGWAQKEPGRMVDVEATTTLADAMEEYLRFPSTREVMTREAGIPPRIFDACVSRLPIELPVRPALEH